MWAVTNDVHLICPDGDHWRMNLENIFNGKQSLEIQSTKQYKNKSVPMRRFSNFTYDGVPDKDFVYNVLSDLKLLKYNATFTDFNVNKQALLHLDPSVVKVMISHKKDRNKFINWLKEYKSFKKSV